MAQRMQVLLVDDVDGGEAQESVLFGLDGVSYEIDLSEANAQKLRTDLATWIGHGRRVGGRRSGGGGPSARNSSRARRPDLGQVREWARQHGHQVSDRGRISADVQAAYDNAHS